MTMNSETLSLYNDWMSRKKSMRVAIMGIVQEAATLQDNSNNMFLVLNSAFKD